MALHQRLFFLTLVLLPTQLGYHVWPEWALVLGRRVDYLSPTVFLTDIFILGIFASWFWQSRKKVFAHFKIPHWAVALAAVFIIGNISVSQNVPEAMYKWVKVLEFVGLGWYVVKIRPNLSSFAFPLSIGVLYSSILAVWQFLLQQSGGGPLWFLGERTFSADTPGIARTLVAGRQMVRPYATFPHPNVLGGYLAVLLPLMINLLIYKSTNLQI